MISNTTVLNALCNLGRNETFERVDLKYFCKKIHRCGLDGNKDHK